MYNMTLSKILQELITNTQNTPSSGYSELIKRSCTNPEWRSNATQFQNWAIAELLDVVYSPVQIQVDVEQWCRFKLHQSFLRDIIYMKSVHWSELLFITSTKDVMF